MFGLANKVVQFLLERLDGIENCRLYQCQHQQMSVTVPPVTEPECLPVIIITFTVFINSSSCVLCLPTPLNVSSDDNLEDNREDY